MRPISLILLLFLTCGQTIAQTEYETLRHRAMSRLGTRIKAGELEAARRDLADHVARFPGDAVMQYNLACLVATAGDADSALTLLQAAIEAGYRDFHQMRTSPYLALLASDPRLHAMLEQAQTDLLERMLGTAFHLVEDAWSDPIALLPDPHGPLTDPGTGAVRFRFDHERLTAAIELPQGAGDEVIAVVALPQSLEEHETSRWFELRGSLSGPGLLDLTGRHGQKTALPGAARLEFPDGKDNEHDRILHIPWAGLHPYRPPIELLLGLNIVIRQGNRSHDLPAAGPAQRWDLIGDPHAGSRLQTWRRFVPVDLDPGPAPAPLLAGRLDNYLVIGDVLSVELGLQGAAGGPARLALYSGTTSLATEPDTVLQATMEPDLAFFTAEYHLGHLPAPGWFQVAADVTDAAGTTFVWQDRGFRLTPDWFIEQHARLDGVLPAERTIVQYQLMGTLRGQQAFNPHDDPAPLAASAQAAQELLDRAEALGTVLPREAGILEAGFPSGQDVLLSCMLVLPDQEGRLAGEVVLVIVPDREHLGALARELDRSRDAGDARLFLVTAMTHLPGQPESATPMIRAALDWIRELAEPEAVRLAGIAAGAEMALHAALDEPHLWQGLLLLGGTGFDPRVLAEPRAIIAEMKDGLGSLPVVLNLPETLEPRTEDLAGLIADHLPGIALERGPELAGGPALWAGRLLAMRP
jgi:hypothetical protein